MAASTRGVGLIVDILALILFTLLTIFLLLIGIALTTNGNHVGAIALVSAALELFNTVWVATLVWRQYRHGLELKKPTLGFSLLLSAVATIWTLVTLILTSTTRQDAATLNAFDSTAKRLVVVQYVFWTLTTFYLHWFYYKFIVANQNFARAVRAGGGAMMESATSFSPLTFSNGNVAISSFVDASNRTASSSSSEGKVGEKLFPKLDIEASPVSASSPSYSFTGSEFSIQTADFAVVVAREDTSTSSPWLKSFERSKSMQRRPSTPPGRTLATIVDNSPGKPLDRPSLAYPVDEDNSPTARGRPTSATSSHSPRDSTEHGRVPPRFKKPTGTSPSSRPVINESFIHPLFRTDNPHPPPTATAGTTVIASAFGGQYISPQTLSSRASSRSRASSPHVRPRSQSIGNRPLSRSKSGPIATVENTDEAKSVSRSRSVDGMQAKALVRAGARLATPPSSSGGEMSPT